MDDTLLKYCHFLAKKTRNSEEFTYRFVYVTNGKPDHEPLPFHEAFMIGGKFTWVLDMDQITAARVVSGRDQQSPEVEEEEEQQQGDQDDAWAEAAGAHQAGHPDWNQNVHGWGNWPHGEIHQHYQAPDHGHQYIPYEQFQALSDQVSNLGNTLYTVSTNVDDLAHNFTSFMNDFHYTPPPPEGDH